MKPYLFLDVDGVLNVRIMPYQEHAIEVDADLVPQNAFTRRFSGPSVTFNVRLPNSYSGWLAELAAVYELAWATTWEHLANTYLSPLLELGELPVVELSAHPPNPEEVRRDYVAEWKWRNLELFADGRPFAFVDDMAARVAANYPLTPGASRGALCVEYGLTREHVDALLAFAVAISVD
jgi:hypothetical protein